jgi:DDE superfamily endonuclease
MGRVAGRFARADLRRRARAFVRGLLADLPRKNCWTIAEHAGHPNPDGMQHLLARAVWDREGAHDDVRGYVVEHLGDPGAVVPTARLDAPPAFAHQVRSNMPNQATRATTCATLRSVEMPAMPGFVAGSRHSLVTRPMSGSLVTTLRPLAGAEPVSTAAPPGRLNRTNHHESRERRGLGW